MSQAPTNVWEFSGSAETDGSYAFVNSTDMINSCIDVDTQEWTNEDMAETTQTIQILEQIVKAQFSLSDDIENGSTYYARADGVEIPLPPPYGRATSGSTCMGQQTRHQQSQAVDDYEPFEGKNSIFDDSGSNGRMSKPSLSRESSDNSYATHDSKFPKGRGDLNDPFEAQYIKSRGKGIIDPHLSDTVERASSKLRNFQRKIIRTIENSPEEVTLQMLLELNESVLSVLSKADVVIASPGHPSEENFPTMVAIIYMLRRGNRMETLTAVKQLTMLCLGVESYVDIATKVVIKTSTMREMRAANALQTLMTALVRCVALDWSEVEMQICRVVSVLVTYEEDWGLLQKNSLEILTAIQSLLVKAFKVKRPTIQPGVRVEMCCDVNSLVAAALAKLSLVLCAWWSKSSVTPPPVATAHTSSSSSTRVSEAERAREALRSSSNRAIPKVPTKSQADLMKILEIVLNVILTMCDDAIVSLPVAVAVVVPNNGVNIPSIDISSVCGIAETLPSSRDLSVSEALSKSLPLLSNSAAVLCSIALCSLAECPQCVAVLVQGGALRLLRCWLDLGTDLMTGIWDGLEKERLSESGVADNVSLSKLLRTKEYVQAFELLTNAAAAVHYLVGGSDVVGDKSLPATDSTAGFIYAQVMAEGLPAALVRLISSSVFDFTVSDTVKSSSSATADEISTAPPARNYNIDTDRDNAELLHLMRMLSVSAALAAVGAKDKEKGNTKHHTAHILPRAAEVHLAQALYQLSNRVQSRAHLQAVGAPFALCRLFVSATERSKGRSRARPAGSFRTLKEETSSHLRTVAEREREKNWDKKNTKGSSIYWDEEEEDDDDFDYRVPPTPQYPSTSDLRMIGMGGGFGGVNDSSSADSRDYGVGNDFFANAIMQLSLDGTGNVPTIPPPSSTSTSRLFQEPSGDPLANNDLSYIKAVTSSCLDALTNFLADDLAVRLRSRSHSVAEDVGKAALSPSSLPFPVSFKSPLSEVMAHRFFLSALKYATCSLSQSKARLAALRTIAALTDWPLALNGMITKGIINDVVLISQERYGGKTSSSNISSAPTTATVTPRHTKRNNSFGYFFQGQSPRATGTPSAASERTPSSTYPHTQSASHSNITTPINSVKAMKMSRSVSAESDQGMDVDASYSNGRACSVGGDRSPVSTMISSSIINHSLCDSNINLAPAAVRKDSKGDPRLPVESPNASVRRNSCAVEGVFSTELMTEETMCMCFSLANAASHSIDCAQDVFNMDLMNVMLRLADSSNLEIVRQALKCIGAMCLVRNTQTPLALTGDQRVTDTRTKQLRSQTYFRALAALTAALSSPSSLVQLEAVKGIANIAGVDEQLCDQAVAGSLRTIISMLLDASCDRDTRNAAEDVLKAVGFIGGMRDLEVCQFDVGLLREWFTIKKSMPPQMLARKLVAHWIEDLFNGAQPVPVVINSSTAHSAPLQIPCPMYSWSNSAPSSGSNSRSGSPIHGRSQMFWNQGGPSSSGTVSGSSTSRGQREKTLLQSAKSELQRRFTDSISKFVPFCMGGSAARVVREEEEEDQEIREIGLDLFSPSAGSNTSNPYGLYEGMDCPPDGVLNLMDIFYASHLQQVLLMDMVSFLSDHVLENLISWNRSDYADSSTNSEDIINIDSDCELDYDKELLRTQQALRHIGPKGEFDRTCARLSLPIPFSLNALLLPMRVYVSFTRVGRVIERIVEQGGDLQPFSLVFRDSHFDGDSHATLLSTLRRCGRIVTLSFANYKTVEVERGSGMGWLVGNLPPSIRFVSLRNIIGTESIQALCILLRKQNLSFLEAPQSYPWSYNNPSPNDPNAKLNPTTVLPKTLKQSMQEDVSAALLPGRSCHPLGLQGIAITHSTFTQEDVKYIRDLLEPVTLSRKSSNTPRSVGDKEKDRERERERERERDRDRDRGDDSTTSSKDTGSNKSANGRPRGLRYLDLGFNRIGCTNCSEILRAAARGDLECLNLAGNFTHRGEPFLNALVETLTPFAHPSTSSNRSEVGDDCSSDGGSDDGHLKTPSKATGGSLKGSRTSSPHDLLSLHLPKFVPPAYTSHLKHLGLSYNNLSSRVLCGILNCLQRNTSLGSLDVSHNSLKHSPLVKESIRNFLRLNRGIRTLDLSHNFFTEETTKAIHLGLLENDVLLLLPLIGNGSAERSAELPLVQHKLRENRVRYKALIDLFNKQADDQERLQKIRRKRDAEKRAELERELEMEMERERELEEERERERELDADSEMLTEKRIENLEGSEVESVIQTEDVVSDNLTDFSDWPTVLSPIRTPPEYDSDGSARMSPPVPNSVPSLSPVMSSRPLSTQSVQFSPLTSIIPPMSLDWTADDGSFTTSPGSPNLGNGDSAPVALGSQSSEESANMLITFGTFPAVSISSSPAPRTPSSDGGLIAPSPFKAVPPTTLLPLPLPLSLPPLLPLLTIPSCGIADVQSPPGLNSTLTYTEPSHIRRASSLLMRPKSMGHILDQQLNARLMQATSPTVGSLRRVKKEKNVLNVLFSAPLAWRDRSNRLHPLEMLDYGAERDALSHVFREVQRDISVIYDFATTDALRTALSFGCRALHFSGHGHESHLNFEDGRSGLQLVNVNTLRSLLSAGGLMLDFVFVSACHSRPTGQAFVDAGVKHVVCVKIEAMIQDSSAMAFTRAFYLALLSGQTVKHSFLIAKEALKASPCIADSVLEGEKFVLLPEGDSHDVPIFLSCHVLEWVSPTYGNSHIPSPPPDFEGREVDMHRIITTLLARRLVSVVGAVGQGKSSLTAAVVTYMNDRKTMFEDGIIYLKPHGSYKLINHRSLLTALLAAILLGPTAVASRLQELQKESPVAESGGTPTNFSRTTGGAGKGDASSGRADSECDGSGGNADADPVYLIEELIVSVLSPFRLLLVLDHIEGLLSNTITDTATDLKFFLGRVFERCRNVKVLVVAGEAMGMGQVSGFGVVENPVSVGPLSLRSSLRLFARLAPALSTSQRKASFVSALMPSKPDVTVHCRELTMCSLKLLALFGNGNPSSIVKLACESSLESVEKLMTEGVDIIYTIEGSGDVVRRRTVSATPAYVLPSSPVTSHRSTSPLSPTYALSSSSSSSASVSRMER